MGDQPKTKIIEKMHQFRRLANTIGSIELGLHRTPAQPAKNPSDHPVVPPVHRDLGAGDFGK